MPRRQRWTPVKGTANRVYDPRERALLRAFDLAGSAALGLGGLVGWRRRPEATALADLREVLVLRLDRIGDVLMSLPALADLRQALPRARIRLAVGRWSEDVARSAPVDELLVWSAPWAGRPSEGALSLAALLGKARELRGARLDLALDLQGDVRANLLAWQSGARRRVGYANSGGGFLLTGVVDLDESVSWVEQNRRAVAAALGAPAGEAPCDPLTDEDRAFAARLFENLGLERARPVVAIHPSGGRLVKQWPIERWAEVARVLQLRWGASLLVTGSAADAALARQLQAGLPRRPFDLTGKLGVRETMAVLSRLDLFLSPDTGPMHMACAVGAPSVSVFGPSDSVRYFSGGSGAAGTRHVVVRAELWCAPCNLIRLPPGECAGPEPPECLRLVEPARVLAPAAALLEARGFRPRELP
ncbi:MAG: glycosyltransferase family 9 protein [Vicinamibacteria bacterium]